jgi:hypothetical protein
MTVNRFAAQARPQCTRCPFSEGALIPYHDAVRGVTYFLVSLGRVNATLTAGLFFALFCPASHGTNLLVNGSNKITFWQQKDLARNETNKTVEMYIVE